ncbi:hypothetical protein Tco_1177210 [Tanacetum coccineum]
MALPPRDQRHSYLRGLTDLMAEGLSGRMLMEHRDAQGQSVLASRAWRRLFEIRGPLVHELILEFFSVFRFGEAVLDFDIFHIARVLQFQLGGVRHRIRWREFILGMGLHTMKEIKYAGFGSYWVESARQILDKGDLSAYWVGISSTGDFLGTALFYTLIRDSVLRLYHRLIACSIAWRSQAPKKVTVTDLFYLMGMDVGSVNIPYLLARYLRMFDLDLPVIDIAELVRLQTCEKLDDTWAWVAPGPERQLDVLVGAPKVAKVLQILLRVLRLFQHPYRHPSRHMQLDQLGFYHRDWLDWRRTCMRCEGHWASKERYWIVWPVISLESLHGQLLVSRE